LPRGRSFEWKKRYSARHGAKRAFATCSSSSRATEKDDDLTTQANERIPHLSESRVVRVSLGAALAAATTRNGTDGGSLLRREPDRGADTRLEDGIGLGAIWGRAGEL
jgi:hypothetical protein